MYIKKQTHFASEQTTALMHLITTGESTSVLGIPGAGITIFLRHFVDSITERKAYVDTNSLPNLTSKEFFKALLKALDGNVEHKNLEQLIADCKEQIEQITKDGDKIVIVIAGFDHLQSEFSTNLLHHLQALHAVKPGKVVYVFGVCKRLDALLPSSLIDTNVRLFSPTFYLKPYSENDCKYLLLKFEKHQLGSHDISRLLQLSGGHFQLLQLLVNSEYKNNPLDDIYIQLVFKNILSHLTTPQKNILKKIALHGTYSSSDSYLTNVGIVIQKNKRYSLFSELFAEYLRKCHVPRLPVKERRLLAVLKKNLGNVVSKHELYDAVWPGQNIGSEWALNALIYRLRRHPAFLSEHYTIENHKKVGYALNKH